jgi:hypothetical protein
MQITAAVGDSPGHCVLFLRFVQINTVNTGVADGSLRGSFDTLKDFVTSGPPHGVSSDFPHNEQRLDRLDDPAKRECNIYFNQWDNYLWSKQVTVPLVRVVSFILVWFGSRLLEHARRNAH